MKIPHARHKKQGSNVEPWMVFLAESKEIKLSILNGGTIVASLQLVYDSSRQEHT